jgi:hypothetical protein
MARTSINKAAIQQAVREGRQNGKTDQEIYNELTETYYDKKLLALTITGVPTAENIGKYKLYNNILLGLLSLSALFKIIMIFTMTLYAGQPLLLLLVFIVPLLNIYFMYEIARYQAYAYRICGLLTIVGFLNSLNGTNIDITNVVINLVIAGSVAGLSFYLDSHLFPAYSPRSLEKDSNGEYILD